MEEGGDEVVSGGGWKRVETRWRRVEMRWWGCVG